MAKFTKVSDFEIFDEITGEWVEPGHWWLEGEMHYRSDLYLPTIIVPDKFKTDLASFPFGTRWMFKKNGPHRAPAVIHDYLCRTWPRQYRPLADKIFNEAMKVRGVPRIRRTLMYWAVSAWTKILSATGGKNE